MHKLDETLQHWGIKGMRWDIKRSPEEIADDAKNNVDAMGEALEDAGDEVLGNDDISDEFDDVVNAFKTGSSNLLNKELYELGDAVKDKVEDIPKDTIEKGRNFLDKLGKKFTIKTTKSSTSYTTSGSVTTKSSSSKSSYTDLYGNKISKKEATRRINAQKKPKKKKESPLSKIYLPAKDR